MNNLDYDLIKLQLFQLENDFKAKSDKLNAISYIRLV